MNCWKTINLSKDYGFQRLFFLSLLTSIIAFIVLYLSLHMLYHSKPLEDNGLVYVLIVAFLLVPGHKIVHIISLKLIGKKVRVKIKRKGFFPIITIKHSLLLSKTLALLTVLAPISFFSTILICLSIMFPAYLHYFTILLAINIGICVSDLLYSYQFLKAPGKCVLEEHNHGYDILIP